MTNEIIALISIVIIIGLASLYILKARKKGIKCIGCPSSSTCKINEFIKDLKDAKEHCCNCSINK